MLRMHLDHVDQLSASIERLDVEVAGWSALSVSSSSA